MRDIREIIVHCTASPWGDVEAIDHWHKQRGWRGIGYHYVILNVYPHYENYKSGMPELLADGEVQEGRPVHEVGAHCYGHNLHSIGVALVGDRVFSARQIESLKELLLFLMKQYNIPPERVIAHYEYNPAKSCPNIDANYIRELVRNVAERR